MPPDAKLASVISHNSETDPPISACARYRVARRIPPAVRTVVDESFQAEGLCPCVAVEGTPPACTMASSWTFGSEIAIGMHGPTRAIIVRGSTPEEIPPGPDNIGIAMTRDSEFWSRLPAFQ